MSPKASEITILNKDALSRSASASSSPRSYDGKLEHKKEIQPIFGQAKNFRKQYNPRAARMEKERARNQRKAKKELEAEERKKKEEEEKRREEEDAVESDHHGRDYVNYSEPRPKYVP